MTPGHCFLTSQIGPDPKFELSAGKAMGRGTEARQVARGPAGTTVLGSSTFLPEDAACNSTLWSQRGTDPQTAKLHEGATCPETFLAPAAIALSYMLANHSSATRMDSHIHCSTVYSPGKQDAGSKSGIWNSLINCHPAQQC